MYKKSAFAERLIAVQRYLSGGSEIPNQVQDDVTKVLLDTNEPKS